METPKIHHLEVVKKTNKELEGMLRTAVEELNTGHILTSRKVIEEVRGILVGKRYKEIQVSAGEFVSIHGESSLFACVQSTEGCIACSFNSQQDYICKAIPCKSRDRVTKDFVVFKSVVSETH